MKNNFLLSLFLTAAFGTLQLGAATYTGTLANTSQVVQENFSVTSPTNVTIFTNSYAMGGFEPSVTLYNAAGNYVASEYITGTSPVAQPDATTGNKYDAYLLQPNLAAGSYIVTLTNYWTQQSPTATNLSDGFTDPLGGSTTFQDQNFATRTGAYSLTVNAGSSSATPEPASALLVLPGLGLAFYLARKRKSSAA